MTAGFAWLLRPDGQHGLGSGVLHRLLDHLGIQDSEARLEARIALEETRDRTRADLVIYGRDWTVVVEAKTFAIEQDDQLHRLYGHWRDDPEPVFVFLTRGVRTPLTAGAFGAEWRELTWREVAEISRAAASSVPDAAPGVYEYISTLEAYHYV